MSCGGGVLNVATGTGAAAAAAGPAPRCFRLVASHPLPAHSHGAGPLYWVECGMGGAAELRCLSLVLNAHICYITCAWYVAVVRLCGLNPIFVW